ncbi:MAG: hypothetical protein V5A22_00180 [Salinivenus sp.]
MLTAEDLHTEQDANATERKRLGRALGTGVLDGLFVRKKGDETVTAESGVALAPSGCVVELPQTTNVSVVSKIDRDETAGTKGQFASCSAREVVAASGTGVYLLFVEPAAKPEGRTPRTRLGGDGAASECGAQYRREGARLRLVHLDTGDAGLVPESLQTERGKRLKIEEEFDEGSDFRARHVSRLRNILAHVCLRTPSALAETASLYDTLRRQSRRNEPNPDGPVDVLRDRAVEENDGLEDAVPIGLLYWAQDRILFVDNWSVRRRVHRSDPQRPTPATDRRRAEGEAAFHQFQAHVGDLTVSGGPAEELPVLEARVFFDYLPAAGLVPVKTEGPHEENLDFVNELTHQGPVYVEGAEVSRLLEQSFLAPPHRIDAGEMLVLYRVRQNRQSNTETPYLLFASGHLPLLGDARFDLSRWDYSQYGTVVHS